MFCNTRIKKPYFILVVFSVFIGCFSFSFVRAAALGEIRNFNIDPFYDFQGRKEISASLVLETDKLYFYIDDSLWKLASASEKDEAVTHLSALGDEFSEKIYPVLSSNYGAEWSPGIDRDPKVTILFHQLKRNSGGYFNSGDEYTKFEAPVSNEREMVYLNANYISSPLLKSLLAHEFTHLITFNQKTIVYGVDEEVWLNEGRAEYAPTLLGYDSAYQGSNLQRKVVEFMKNPQDSIIDWQGALSDYGALDMFIQYLVDQYGMGALNDSLHSSLVGIDSVNYALKKRGFGENLSDIFNDWNIAVLLNNCSLGQRYCYKSKTLSNLKVIPFDVVLPEGGVVYVNQPISNWGGSWYRLSGGERGALNINLSVPSEFDFRIFYVVCGQKNDCSLNFLRLDEQGNAKISVGDFNSKYFSLTLMPLLQSSNGIGELYISWDASIESANADITDNTGEKEPSSKPDDFLSQLEIQIENIRKKIIEIGEKIEELKRMKIG